MTNLADLPITIRMADVHNQANAGLSWTDPNKWTEKLGNAGKFMAGSILSGANSYYNTALTVGRWTGLTQEADRDTGQWISSLDSSMGEYYKQNQEGMDLTGFVLGSLAPGLGGVRIFNAGQAALRGMQAGELGTMSSRALGLLVPRTDKYLQAAQESINASTTAVKLINTNTIRAMESGLRQNVLESAAFEIAAVSTQIKSPTLDNMDVGDIVWNIALGGVLGGVVGGAFGTAKLLGSVKTAVQKEDALRKGFIETTPVAKATPAADKVIQFAYDADFGGAVPITLRTADGSVIPNNYQVNSTLYQDRHAKLMNGIRENIREMSTDNTLGNLVADISAPIRKDGKNPVGFSNDYLANFSGAVKITSILDETPLEIAARKAMEAGKAVDVPVAARYLTLQGENVGEVLATRPLLPTIADTVGAGEAVTKFVRTNYAWKSKYEDGASWSALALTPGRGYREAEARYIWALRPEEGGVLKEIPAGSLVNAYDIPLLTRAYRDGNLAIQIQKGEGPTLEILRPTSKEELLKHIHEAKIEVAARLNEKWSLDRSILPEERSSEAISRITDLRVSYMEGQWAANPIDDLFASETATRQFRAARQTRELGSDTPGAQLHSLLMPRHAKVVYELSRDVAAQNENILNAITYFKAKQADYETGARTVFAKISGPLNSLFPNITDKMMGTAFRTGSGPGLFSFENSNYGTIGSTFAFIGSLTRNMKQEFRKQTSDALESALVKMGQVPEAAIELETLNQKVTRHPGQFVLRQTTVGEWALIDRAAITETVDGKKVIQEIADFELLEEGVNSFTVRNDVTVEALKAHIGVTGSRTVSMREIRAQQGLPDYKDPDTYRPLRPDLKQYPHFAFVKNDKITGAGHITMIHAATEKELEALADRVPAQYRVIFKGQAEEFRKATGEYDFSRTLNENYINADLAKEGVFSNFFPRSDPAKIVNDMLQQHLRESDTLVTEAVRLRYEAPFQYLEKFGKQYSKAATSRFASRADLVEQSADNPFFNYIKTALDISKINEHPLVYGFNKLLDDAVSKAESARQNVFARVTSPSQLDEVNALLDKYGTKPAYYNADMQALVNHTAPRGVLTKFVRQANSLLSLFTLGLDPLNALNNAIGSNILRQTELKHLYQAIQAGDAGLAGELSALAKIKLPGTGDEILAPTKLTGAAIRNFWKDDGTLMARYKGMGLIKDRAEQLKMLADDFTLKGTETVSELERRTATAFSRAKELAGDWADKGEKATGNKLSEEFNRFISANVMDQLTSLAVKRGLMDEKTALAYINTFVNRVEGNIVASQRPLIFQGPIGQAVSLFQSYQFNLLQQLFRYVAEGSKKDLAVLGGLQSTLYGLQSLPAFQFINVHLIGQLSGNTEHRDTYDAVYGITGKVAGDFILYGLPSNMLFGWGEGGGTNIYSRGDINPRQLTILPTTLQEIPIVQGWGKFLANLYDTTKKIAGGADMWETFLQGMEHNGISRPLAGLAQTLQAAGNEGVAYSTSSKGSILYQNDLLSLATVSRLAGGRPLNEAIVNDAMFRVKKYEAARRESMLSLGERVKSTLIQGNEPSEDQVAAFAQKYAELGGKQAGFNKWMMDLYKSANTSQAEQLQGSLSNPFAYKVQLLMGGEDE